MGVSKVLLDMDGVIADFVGGACRKHKINNPWSNGANAGVYGLESLMGLSRKEFWAPFDEDFWSDLEPTKEAKEVVALLESYFSDRICILSSPPMTGGGAAISGKINWLTDHFPQFKRRFLFGPEKHYCANPRHLLVDDFDKNTHAFEMSGGKAFLFPRPWNGEHASEASAVEELAAYLEGLM